MKYSSNVDIDTLQIILDMVDPNKKINRGAINISRIIDMNKKIKRFPVIEKSLPRKEELKRLSELIESGKFCLVLPSNLVFGEEVASYIDGGRLLSIQYYGRFDAYARPYYIDVHQMPHSPFWEGEVTAYYVDRLEDNNILYDLIAGWLRTGFNYRGYDCNFILDEVSAIGRAQSDIIYRVRFGVLNLRRTRVGGR